MSSRNYGLGELGTSLDGCALRLHFARVDDDGTTVCLALTGLAAMIGLGVQAALAVASAVYQGEHGLVIYLPVGGPFAIRGHPRAPSSSPPRSRWPS